VCGVCVCSVCVVCGVCVCGWVCGCTGGILYGIPVTKVLVYSEQIGTKDLRMRLADGGSQL